MLSELKRNLFIVDVEADGPCPGLYSMVCFGAVYVNDPEQAFYGACRPLPDANWIPENLAPSGFTREEHEKFPDPFITMVNFLVWLNNWERPVFVSDNPAFDWQFINYYFALYNKKNPFGWSARRIGDFYAGLNKNWDDQNSWKDLRQTTHDHNPVNDARGNAEALLQLLWER